MFRGKKNKNIFKELFKKKSPLEKFYLANREFIDYCLVSLVCTGILYLVSLLQAVSRE